MHNYRFIFLRERLADASDFIRIDAFRHFYFGVPEGWKGMDVRVKDEEVV